jgi:hypothetical protein
MKPEEWKFALEVQRQREAEDRIEEENKNFMNKNLDDEETGTKFSK